MELNGKSQLKGNRGLKRCDSFRLSGDYARGVGRSSVRNAIHKGMCALIIILLCITFTATAHEPEVQLPFDRPHAQASIEGHMHTGWESRYFSEGRDSLDGDSLWATSFELGRDRFSGGVWYGTSPDQSYDELQLMLGLTEVIGDFEFYVAYTHLQFPSSDLHDNEIGMGASWSGLPLSLEVAADAYYSFDAEGSFWELALNHEMVISDRLSLIDSVVFGVNQGYIPDGHDGANHFALRIGTIYVITKSLSVTAHTAYNWALNSDSTLAGDDQLIDFFHGGVGLQWSF